ncbi:MAG TPA: glycosyltransferase [Candidatus Paceibacterota bacterium]|nr:glycosyltransferase [Candidatus Paceibacterota bacterium]
MEEKTKYRPISIIITAYKASAFIEDCLDSIEAQAYFENNDKYEILLGIDACPETLQKVKIIGHKYRNLRVFMMEKNIGTYVTSNTLLDIAQYPNIIRFDSDDIMLPEMVEEILQHSEEYDLIQYGFKTFTTRKEDAKETHYWPACGSVFCKKSFIDAAGGYRDWKCSADLELLKRTQNYPHKRYKIEKRLFLLRSHPNSLGNSEYTKLRGHYRKGVESKIRILPANQDPKIEKRISDYKEIDFNLRDLKETFSTGTAQIIKRESLRSNFGISIIITAWKTANYIEQCLDSIESQSYFTNNNNYEILLGIDGCQETLAKVKEILEKYRNLRVFMMEENVGTYVTTNTLLDLVSYDNIIRFDSDDYMLPCMISEVMAASEEYDFIRFHFDDFDEVRKEMRPRAFLAMGAVYYKKWVIEKAGGYKDWKCNADLELLKRISNSDIRFGEIKRPLFVRRIHPNSLSEREETGIRSFFRKNLTNRIRIYDKGEEIKIEKVVGKFHNIFPNENFDYDICIIITTFNREVMLKKLLDDIQSYKDPYRVLTIIFDDGSSNYLDLSNYNIKYIKYLNNNGKKYYWKIITDTMEYCKNISSKYFIYLPDDISLAKNFFNKSIQIYNSIQDPNKICLSLLMPTQQIGKPNWTNFYPIDLGEYYQTQWCDLCFISEKKIFEVLNYKIDPIPLSRWKNKNINREYLGSGVGQNLSIRLNKRGYKMYHIKKSLALHLDHPSVMNPNIRVKEKLTT